MPSLLPGYTYDIFISYRHKDNKYDGWVSEFVANLRKEIDATIKDDVSIYFDENPHDGLRETDDVDASLSGKLRCLIFIPVLSQTYCDQKSFAWKSEFLAFNKLIKEDAIGPKVILPNGNVSSRILPVRIHDLDAADKNLIETEIGPLRAIDFIYKEQGVNRPLRPTDSKTDNQNKTDYRNQVNKLANAVKDLIGGLSNPKVAAIKSTTAPVVEAPASKLPMTIGIIAAAVIAVASLIYWLFPGSTASEDYKYDVAVLYLENLTQDEKYSDGLANLIQMNLSEDTSLSVAPRHMLYEKLKAINPDSKTLEQSSATELAKSIGTKFMITGSIIQQSSEVMAQVELIEVSSGKVVTSKKVRGVKDNIFDIADQISSQLMQGRSLQKEYNVQQVSTGNYDAYKEFYQGLEYFWNVDIQNASNSFSKAIQLDSSFAAAYVYKATNDNLYAMWAIYDNPGNGLELLERGTRDMQRLTRKDQLLAKLTMKRLRSEDGQAELAQQLMELDPDDKFALLLNGLINFDKPGLVNSYEEFLTRHPREYELYNNMAYLYFIGGDLAKAKHAADEYMRTVPGVFNSVHSGWELYAMTGDLQGSRRLAEQITKEFKSIKNRYAWIGITDLLENKPDDAFKVYAQWHDSTGSLEMRTLGYSSLVLQGRLERARSIADEEMADSKKRGSYNRMFYYRMDKALMYMLAGKSAEVQKELDRTIEDSERQLEYNPFIFIGHFYKGMDYVASGNLNSADVEVKVLDDLLASGKNDARFKPYLDVLKAERAMADGDVGPAKKILEPTPIHMGPACGFLLMLDLKYLITSNQLKEALSLVDRMNTMLYSGRPNYGGSQVLLTEMIALRDYYRGVVYEKMGDKAKAKQSYEAFLLQMKGADVKSVQITNATTALKGL